MFTRFGPFALPFVVVDLPLALVFDTAFLPADVITVLTPVPAGPSAATNSHETMEQHLSGKAL